MPRTPVLPVDPEFVNAKTGAAVLDVSERAFYELVRRGDVRKIQIPGMRRTTYSLNEIRAVAAKWRGDNRGDAEDARR